MPITTGDKLLITKGCLLGGLRLPVRDQLSLRGFGWPMARICVIHSACTLCTIDRDFIFKQRTLIYVSSDVSITFVDSWAGLRCGCECSTLSGEVCLEKLRSLFISCYTVKYWTRFVLHQWRMTLVYICTGPNRTVWYSWGPKYCS